MFADFCIIFMNNLQLSAVNLRCIRLGSASFGRHLLQFVHGYLTKFINDININLDYWRKRWKSDQDFTIFMLWKLILPTQQVPNWNASIKSLEKWFLVLLPTLPITYQSLTPKHKLSAKSITIHRKVRTKLFFC